MKSKNTIAALLVSLAASYAQAAPAVQLVSLRDGADTLIVPAASPVRYRSIGSYDDVHFTGRFTLSGEFHYGCEYDCDGPDRDLQLYIVPDMGQQLDLPHWSKRSGKLRVYIDGAQRFAIALNRPTEVRRLRTGKLSEITGRVSIVVKNYIATIECDSASYSATFVALQVPVQLAALPADDHGC